ncbi:MAG TPA: 2-oxoacid:acceptor oxidoreductase subunit alpha [Anaerolineales bacterium]|nr:2-oxoacid:acceptor oxidoreductase subunit alpha [Anaerolineales bacterium]
MDKGLTSIYTQSDIPVKQPPVINDFSITIATVNGSGSQTANLTLLRALFRMGIPVSGKNIFPSNIQGMPTWYTLRLSDAGFLARRQVHEVVVAMNPATFVSDLADVTSGGAFFYDDSIKVPIDRQDIAIYPMPIKQLVREAGTPSSLRDYIANMVYVGIVAQIIGIDTDKIWQALEFQFKGKEKAIDLNWGMVKAAVDWASVNLKKADRYFARQSNKTDGFIMADGNTAAALGSLYGGMHFCAWYPITPATSLAETVNEYVPVFRKDPVTGKNTCVVVQAEDELAAVGMIVGAGYAGLRAMTSTSGPGISLMTEYVGLAYFAEVPIVLWDVQRVGPSTGLPTRTSQGDLKQIYFMGHGDTRQIMLLPGSVTECFEFGWRAFDIADQYQTPVFVLSDLDFGMNQWMTRPFQYPDTPINRGKILWEEDLERRAVEAANGKGVSWGRYLDVDGDGIPYRTVPGNRHPAAAYFARGTGHDEYGRYSESAEVWERNMKRLKKKVDGAVLNLPEPVVKRMDGAEIGFLAFGSTDDAIMEAIHMLTQRGQKIDYMRLRALPSPSQVGEFIQQHQRTYVIELNRDGQLRQILSVEFPDLAAKMVSLAHLDGMPLSAEWLVDAFLAEEVQ